MPDANRVELDFTRVFAIRGIHQQITLKEGKSIIWSRDKLKAKQPGIDPVCAGVCGIRQITWEGGRKGRLAEGQRMGEGEKGRAAGGGERREMEGDSKGEREKGGKRKVTGKREKQGEE